jgi:TRAP-type C4-dicarboxylate transport system substrate-binding protein
MTRKIRWIVAHEPIHLFLRTAEAFSKEIYAATDGALEVEVLTLSEYLEKYPNKELSTEHPLRFYRALLKGLENGDFEITQTQTSNFWEYNTLFKLIDLPFLFDSHDHCAEVLEGPIGQGLSASLAKRGNMHGLAYTYSGGFRVIGSDEPISSVSELTGKRIRTNTNPVTALTMEAFGATPKSQRDFPHLTEIHSFDSVKSGELDAVDTTYLRFVGKHVLKTNHSMFLTQIVAGGHFWDSLTPELQEKVRQAAINVSRTERKWSIEDAEKFEAECKANGVAIHEISEDEVAELKTRAKAVYEKYYEIPAAKQLIEKITLH